MNAMRIITSSTAPAALATEVPRGRTPAWWGMVLLIVTEVMLFAVLLASYFYVQFTTTTGWPPAGIKDPELRRALTMTGLLLASSVSMLWAGRAIGHGRQAQLTTGLAITVLLGCAFLYFQAREYESKLADFTWSSNAYGSLYYSITGLHAVHIVLGVAMLVFLLAAAAAGRFGVRRHLRVRLVALFWQSMVGLWIFLLAVLYLSPHL